MKTAKKIIASVLAVAIVLTAMSVSSFAWEKDYIDYSECLGLSTDIDGNYYLSMQNYLCFNTNCTFSFYRVDADGTRTLLKSLSAEESEIFDSGEPIQVDKNMFSEGGKYVMTIEKPKNATETDAWYEIDDEYEFTYDDLKNKYIKTLQYDFCITEGESIDLSEYILVPVGYDGEIMYFVYNDDDYFEDSYIIRFDDFAEVDGSVITALSHGAVYVYPSKDNGESDVCIYIEILDKEPETFMELLEDSAKKLGEGWFNASVESGMTFMGLVALVIYPALIPFMLIYSMITYYL